MTWREFVGPVLAGLVVAAAVFFWLPEDVTLPGPRLPDVPDAESPYVLLPTAGAEGDRSTLLHLGGTPRHGLASIVDIHAGTVHDGVWHWDGTDLRCMQGGDCVEADTEVALAPASGNGTFNTSRPARITFYIFTDQGHLLATNAPISQWADYELDGEFTQVSGQWWSFAEGNATGAQQAPAFRAEARALLDGVPVGAVRSVYLPEHEYEWLVGPLWVTLRIDAV